MFLETWSRTFAAATPCQSRVLTVLRLSRSFASSMASRIAAATGLRDEHLVDHLPDLFGVQMAPTSGSCSTASFSRSTSPVTAAWTDMR